MSEHLPTHRERLQMMPNVIEGSATQTGYVKIQTEKSVAALRWRVLHDARFRIQEIDNHGVARRAGRSTIEEDQWMRGWLSTGLPLITLELIV